MANAEDLARDEAIAWRIRLGSADESEWTAFMDWLDRDPVNRRAYDRVALTDTDLSAILVTGLAEGRQHVALRPIGTSSPALRRATWLAAVAAAGAIVMLGYTQLFQSRSLEAIETAAGTKQTVTLDGGTRVHLNGGSHMLVDRRDPRFVRLQRGEAAFEVVHDADKPFTVQVNGATIQDVGTVFDISTSSKGFALAVAEGAVILNPGAENVRLSQGGSVFVPLGEGPISVGSKDMGSIGSWRRGQLIYDNERVEMIALDLSRALGTPIAVNPAISHRSFTGVIILTADQELLFRRLEFLLGVKASRSDAGWRLDPANLAAKPSVVSHRRN